MKGWWNIWKCTAYSQAFSVAAKEIRVVRLESEVRKCFARSEHMVSVFFDLEMAYDMTWRHGIVQNLHSAGLRGYLPKYIRDYEEQSVPRECR